MQPASENSEPKSTAEEPCVFFKPVRKSSGNLRKRTLDEEAAPQDAPDHSAVVRPAPKSTKSLNVSSPQTKSLKSGREKSDLLTNPNAFNFEASHTAATISDQRTFAYNLIDEDEPDPSAERKRETPAAPKAADSLEGKIITDPEEAEKLLMAADKTYKGMSGYTKYIEKKPSHIKIGPTKGSSNVRLTSRFDYQPDICKDYKETGYCGFGDSCKFMHDRGDYKSGWQMEKEWDEAQRNKKVLAGGEMTENFEVPESTEEELPFACFLCREPFDTPVVTKCQHYFCEKCALSHHKKSKKCFVCGTPTGGIFNVAHKILKKQKAEQQKNNAAAVQILMDGEQQS